MRILLAILLIAMSSSVLSLDYSVIDNDKALIAQSLLIEQQIFNQQNNVKFGSVELATTYQYLNNIDTNPSVVPVDALDNYSFIGELTLHNSSQLHIKMTANFSERDELTSDVPVNNISAHIQHQQKSNHLGLIGSYSLSASWQLSGGILQSVPTNSSELINQSDTINSIALISTSYSF